MNRMRKFAQKDRYGIVRGAVLVALLFALCASLFMHILVGYEDQSEREHASEAARWVALQFDGLVEGCFDQMDTAAVLLEEEQVDERAALGALVKQSPFSDAGVIRNGEILHVDGSIASVGELSTYILYDGASRLGKFIAQEDGQIQLRLTISGGGELAAWIDPKLVDKVLRSTFDGEYACAIYNDSTGAYLVNHTSFSDGGYYDALLGLNENGRMTAMINADVSEIRIGKGDNSHYIAQQPTSFRPWNIVLILPEALVKSDSPVPQMMYMLAFVAGALLVLALLVCVVVSVRRARHDKQDSLRAVVEGERLLNTVAKEARLTMLVYYRGQDKLMACYDGLNLIGGTEGGVCFSSLDALIEACRLEESDAERMNKRLLQLAPGDEAQLIARCMPHNQDERMFRFVFSVPADDGQTVFCSVRDYTSELLRQDREEEERNYFEANLHKASQIWQLDVTHNRCCAVYMRQDVQLGKLGVEQGIWQECNGDFLGLLRTHFLKDDYEVLAARLNPAGIAAMYRSGQTQYNQDYRVCTQNGKKYMWHRMKMRITTGEDNDSIIANVYVFDIDAEKDAEFERGERKRILGQALTALGGVYYALYYVNLDQNLCYAAKSHGGALVKELSAPYDSTIGQYVETMVHAQEREQMRKLLDAYLLRRNMAEGAHFQSSEYRRLTGDGYKWTEMIVQPARFENGTVREVVLALRDISESRPNAEID